MEQKSKSQAKREMLALQALGEQLIGLRQSQIAKIEMPRELRDAVLFAKGLKKGEALRRQMQYIGALMRETDPEPIRKALDEIGSGKTEDAQQFKRLEQWRDALVDGNDKLLEDILDFFPDADRQRLRLLVLNARKEKEGNNPPKSFRSLFRYLRELSGTRSGLPEDF